MFQTVFFVCCFLLAPSVTGQGLYFSITRTPGQQYCGHLLCWTTGSASVNIQTARSLTIYDISPGQAKAKLTSVSINSGLYVDESKSNDINANGLISNLFANVTLDLSTDVYCLHRTFLCEFIFVDLRGTTEIVRKVVDQQGQSIEPESSPQLSWLVSDAQREIAELKQKVKDLENENTRLKATVDRLTYHMMYFGGPQLPSPLPTVQTSDLFEQDVKCYRGMARQNSRERITLFGNVQTLCDTETDGGGWIVIQRRVKSDVSFYRGWTEYKNGFGSPDGDFWIGNDVIHKLTSLGLNELRIDVQQNGQTFYSHYTFFKIGDEASGYALSTGEYLGTFENSFPSGENGTKFSTFDRDNDRDNINCALYFSSGWWYNICYSLICSVTGPADSWFSGCHDVSLNGVWRNSWWTDGLSGFSKVLSFSEMKIRRP